MASRFKSLFPWSSTIPDNLPRGRSYDPPISSADLIPKQQQVKPKQNQEEESPPPLRPQSRNGPLERPKTAPQKAATWDAGENSGRTRSGFSMKTPPIFPGTSSRKNSISATSVRSRRNSIWSIRTTSEAPPPMPAFPSPSQLPPLPMSPAVHSFTSSPQVSSPSSPQLPNSSNSSSEFQRAVPKPYIDLLAAHSTIKTPASRSRPLVVRDYGEDIADRNIATFGEKAGDKAYTTRPRPKHIQILVKGDDGMGLGGSGSGSGHPDGSANGSADGRANGSAKERAGARSPNASGMGIGGETHAQKNPQYDAPPLSPRTTSIRSFTAARPGIAYPPRSDSLRSEHTTSSVSASGDERVIPSIVVQDRRGHTMSPLASPATSVFEDANTQVKEAPKKPSSSPRPAGTSPSPTRNAPPPPIPDRASRRSPSVNTVRSASGTSQSKPVPPLPSSGSSGTPSRQTSTSSSVPDGSSLSESPKRRTRSRFESGRSPTRTSIASSREDAAPPVSGSGRAATHSTRSSSGNISLSTTNDTATPTTISPNSTSTHRHSPSTASSTTAASRKRASSRNGSVSYSAFPSYTTRENRLSDTSASARRRSGSRSCSRRRDNLGSRGTVDLAPMVGRENSVDTQVSTRVAPAVEQENVIVTKKNIQHDSVMIETHTHDVFHRVQPVIEKEVLPARHFMPSSDGKTLVEIPASQIPKTAPAGMKTHEIHGQQIIPPPPLPQPMSEPAEAAPAPSTSEETATPPVVGLARGEPTTRSRRNSAKSVKAPKSPKPHKSTRSRAKSLLQPVLASKKEYMTEAGHPKTEYVWHHPSVMQNEDNTRPIYVGAGVGDLGSPSYSSDEEEDLAGARFGAAAGEGALLFKDADYERSGTLPGLARQPDYRELYEPRDESLANEMRNMRM